MRTGLVGTADYRGVDCPATIALVGTWGRARVTINKQALSGFAGNDSRMVTTSSVFGGTGQEFGIQHLETRIPANPD